ncbi:MAG: hypothetical protein WAV18_26890, partial [Roseiarcus sp.]
HARLHRDQPERLQGQGHIGGGALLTCIPPVTRHLAQAVVRTGNGFVIAGLTRPYEAGFCL